MSNNVLYHWFAHPWALSLLWLLPILSIAGYIAARRRRRALMRLGRLPALAGLVEQRRRCAGLRQTAVWLGLSILAIGIAGPQWGVETTVPLARGRDVVIVLDLSRSMLADDVLPSRLEVAQDAIRQLVESMKRRGGHRIALVAFAGRARVYCPLTNDYDHFLEKLGELDAEHLPPELRPGPGTLSGTRIGAALAAAVEVHDARFQGAGVQDILLLSDGDDPANDNEWAEGAEAAASAGIPVYPVGIGDPNEGRPIPLGDREFMRHQGQVVRSRLTEKPLQEIAERTRGHYTAARTSPVELVDLFRSRIESGRKREAVDEAPPVYRQRYPWFYGAALGLLMLEMTAGRRRPRKPVPADKTATTAKTVPPATK